MPGTSPLPVHKLHANLNPAAIPWEDSSRIPFARMAKAARNSFQPRAMHALELSLRITQSGYNIYLSGEPNLGRSYMLLSWLKPLAAKAKIPPDLIYAQNFTNPDSPRLISLPAGSGKKFKHQIKNLIENIKLDLEKRLDTTNFIKRRTGLAKKFYEERSEVITRMNELAEAKGFNLELEENGSFSLSPLHNGRKLALEELDKMDAAQRMEYKRKGDHLARNLVGLMRKFSKMENSFHVQENCLEKEAMLQTLHFVFSPTEKKILKNYPAEGMSLYLEELRADILNNTFLFLQNTIFMGNEDNHDQEENFSRYAINLFVDNSDTNGAPIIIDDNPSLANLLGCIERESEMGALVTDISLIRSGSMHRANGGYLVLHADDLLQHPFAWEGFLRALRSGKAQIEDSGEMLDSGVRTKGLRPQPVDLNLKVILIGDEDIYETLLLKEERFAKIFRIKAHMSEETKRVPTHIRLYLSQVARIIDETGLLVFDATALAWLVDFGSHLCEDQSKLSLKFALLKEIMIEGDALARMENMKIVNAEILEKAYYNKNYRANLLEDNFMEDYDRELIKLATSGSAIGEVNGLSVSWTGDFEFGLPHRISCTVGVGQDGLLDIERESELAGPLHTKAILILKSFLTGLFARKKPLTLSASLYFQQSYSEIDGDSASAAELAALLSALAEIPVRLDLAFTGAVNHSGQIMAVGGVSKKIEGFYKVCARHGLTGSQGVIIPYDNQDHLMLSPELISSVRKGEFFIYAVRDIGEAMCLLTGKTVGKRRKNGNFTTNSLYDLVDKRLENLGHCAQNAFHDKRKK